MTDDDLVKALRALPRESEPPAELEGRVVGRLREEGLLDCHPERESRDLADGRHDRVPPARPGPSTSLRMTRLAAAAAIVIAVFLGGFAAGRFRDVEEPTHVLLVHRLESTPQQVRERVREYGKWARNLAGGEKLSSRGWVIDASQTAVSPANEVSGYFLIRAESDDTALAIARTCPHIKHGGRVELRRIER